MSSPSSSKQALADVLIIVYYYFGNVIYARCWHGLVCLCDLFDRCCPLPNVLACDQEEGQEGQLFYVLTFLVLPSSQLCARNSSYLHSFISLKVIYCVNDQWTCDSITHVDILLSSGNVLCWQLAGVTICIILLLHAGLSAGFVVSCLLRRVFSRSIHRVFLHGKCWHVSVEGRCMPLCS